MPAGLKRFKVTYKHPSGDVREVYVYAYDIETAKSRAAHEGAVEEYAWITGAEPAE